MAYPRRRVVWLLRVAWIVLLFYGEVGVFYFKIARCPWPDGASVVAAGAPPVHVAIVADPQIVDHYSYGQTGALLRVVEFFTDIYVRKAYVLLQQLRQPSVAVFLGDLMDGGREWDTDAWLAEYRRYRSIFANRRPDGMEVYEMAGNHDIGIGNTVVEPALERFRWFVGPTNQVFEAGGHQIILLDTLTLESDRPHMSNSSRQLVERLERERTIGIRKPRVLFSHVPLWRPPGTPCGPLRQSRRELADGRGYQFRNLLFQNTTRWLLDAIEPDVVFSGDDHDTCIVEHTVSATGQRVAEHTVGAFGWACGVPIPSYALLTLRPPTAGSSSASFDVQHCFLPNQLGIYKCYAAAFLVSLLLVAAASCRGRWGRPGAGYMKVLNPPGLPLPAAARPRSHGAGCRTPALRIARIMVDVAVAAVPVYVACVAYWFL
ncbi:hypothetical protein H4R19_000610 [Coemansia spiralis]|nr:hypothetical protein H4R19_000610 [Coemansia spiralis]